jgi:hypothetical protein
MRLTAARLSRTRSSEIANSPHPHALGGWVLVRVQHVLRDGNAMRRQMDAVLAKNIDDIAGHEAIERRRCSDFKSFSTIVTRA